MPHWILHGGAVFGIVLLGIPVTAVPPKIKMAAKSTSDASESQQSFQSLDDIVQYIAADWDNLSRSLTQCKTYEDTKIPGEPVLYLPSGAAEPAVLDADGKGCPVRVERLPGKVEGSFEKEVAEIHTHGLLYLPNPYVVPGGQFNEMYGWDSYFIILGLLRDGRTDVARGMVENFFYEMEHYGGVLNANRTYYLGRSQPPFLTSMILAVYDADKAAGKTNLEWLRRAYAFAASDYEQWNQEPHLAGDTGLSRYFDEGDGPVPEIMGDPSDYYQEAVHYFLLHKGEKNGYLVRVDREPEAGAVIGPIFEEPCGAAGSRAPNSGCEERVALSRDFYKGDRSMRESGFDVTFRFGPFGAETHHYAPVCLNSLLYKTEKDLEEMSRLLGREEDAKRWEGKAVERQKRINTYFWDAQRGMFYDYNFVTQKRSSYDYATTFYPLWAGLASPEQARAVDANLKVFEQSGGLAMSRFNSQAQWDYPYGWAPIHLLTIEGLRRYGYNADADRLSYKFLDMILQNFRHDHTIREKYDVVAGTDLTHIGAGYAQNETGFGWTNAVFLELLHAAPPELVNRLRKD